MPELLQAALGAIIRHGFGLVAIYFVNQQIWSAEEATNYSIAFALWATGLIWSLYQKYKGTLREIAGRLLPANASKEEVEEKVNREGYQLLNKAAALFVAMSLAASGIACAKGPVEVQVADYAIKLQQATHQVRVTSAEVESNAMRPEITASVAKIMIGVEAISSHNANLGKVLIDYWSLKQAGKDPSQYVPTIKQLLADIDALTDGLVKVTVSDQTLATILQTVLAVIRAVSEIRGAIDELNVPAEKRVADWDLPEQLVA